MLSRTSPLPPSPQRGQQNSLTADHAFSSNPRGEPGDRGRYEGRRMVFKKPWTRDRGRTDLRHRAIFGGPESSLTLVSGAASGSAPRPLKWTSMDDIPSRPPSWPPPASLKESSQRPLDEPSGSHWLLDGYNVLHAALLPGEMRSQTRWWGSEGRERLIQCVQHFDEIRAEKKSESPKTALEHNPTRDLQNQTQIWIVFDGEDPHPESEQPSDQIQVLFRPSADDYLVSRARRSACPDSLFIVSSDKQVAGRCAHAGAQIVKPRDFVARCSPGFNLETVTSRCSPKNSESA